jgi:DNA-binding transcriptional regulator LsrR (DeoR family)
MEKTQRDFKGVWIPKEIWLSDKLSLMEKVLFVEIHSLDNERGCFASNRHFAEFFNISERQITTYISSLKDKGFITVSILDRNDRTIRTAGKYARVSDEQIRRLQQMRSAIADRFSVHKRGRG